MLSNTQTGMGRSKMGNATAGTPTSSARSRKNSGTASTNGQDGAGSAASAAPTHDEIVARAYQIYVKKGRAEGRDMENWLEAEQELHRERGMKTAKR